MLKGFKLALAFTFIAIFGSNSFAAEYTYDIDAKYAKVMPMTVYKDEAKRKADEEVLQNLMSRFENKDFSEFTKIYDWHFESEMYDKRQGQTYFKSNEPSSPEDYIVYTWNPGPKIEPVIATTEAYFKSSDQQYRLDPKNMEGLQKKIYSTCSIGILVKNSKIIAFQVYSNVKGSLHKPLCNSIFIEGERP